MPDNWFSQKEDVPYLFLSANPWACSCSLGYLRRYLEEYDLNVYVRDGTILTSDAESVVSSGDRRKSQILGDWFCLSPGSSSNLGLGLVVV